MEKRPRHILIFIQILMIRIIFPQLLMVQSAKRVTTSWMPFVWIPGGVFGVFSSPSHWVRPCNPRNFVSNEQRELFSWSCVAEAWSWAVTLV